MKILLPTSGEEAKGGEEMKQKITNAEAVQAADTLRKLCNQFTPQHSCDGCPFYWEDAPMWHSPCRLEMWRWRGNDKG